MVPRRFWREPGRCLGALFPNCASGKGRCGPLFIASAAALSAMAGPQRFGRETLNARRREEQKEVQRQLPS
jgi:hypothetical protein